MKSIFTKQQIFPGVFLFMIFCSGMKGISIKRSYCTCDWKNKYNEKGASRIIGGEEAEAGEYPFMAGLFEAAGGSLESVQCGATVLGPSKLLTAAHCINPFSNYSVVAGVLGLFRSDLASIRNVIKIDANPNFDENTLAGDIAMLTVDRPFDFSLNRIGPVCLSRKKRKKHSEFRIIGWGTLSNMTTPQYLQEVSVEEYYYHDCRSKHLIDKLDGKQFCTLSKEKGPCLGDSGGPVLAYDVENETYTLEGIVSKGPADCKTLPSVHINIHHPEYIQWITKISTDRVKIEFLVNDSPDTLLACPGLKRESLDFDPLEVDSLRCPEEASSMSGETLARNSIFTRSKPEEIINDFSINSDCGNLKNN